LGTNAPALADPEIRQIVERILALRILAPPSHLAKSQGLLLSRPSSRHAFYQALRQALWRRQLSEPVAAAM
jgi:hypothetical protein